MATKERDNTWLQLQVCPAVWRLRDEEETAPCTKALVPGNVIIPLRIVTK